MRKSGRLAILADSLYTHVIVNLRKLIILKKEMIVQKVLNIDS